MWASNNQKGFTLIEILIAIVLLSFVTFGVVQITDDAVNTKERTIALNNDNLQIEMALARMDWDFSQIYSPMYYSTPLNFNQAGAMGNQQNPDGQSNQMAQANYQNVYREQLRTRFQASQHFMNVSTEGILIPRFYAADKSTFEFMTSSNRRKVQNSHQSHYAWIRYSLDDAPLDQNPDKNELIPQGLGNLVRYVSNDDVWADERIDPDDMRVKKAILLENVESLEFEFWDLERRKWETTLRTIKNGESIVRGVRMKIAWFDDSGIKRNVIKVFRTHWPLTTPVAQNPQQNGTQGGNQNGGQTGGINNSQMNNQGGSKNNNVDDDF